jgi:hypothetical protein
VSEPEWGDGVGTVNVVVRKVGMRDVLEAQVVDADGVIRERLRLGPSTMQYHSVDSKTHKDVWKDATERWPHYPAWVRRMVPIALKLRTEL